MVELQNIEKSYGSLQVLKGVNISISKGKTVAILGPNGSGKTTIIKSILGLVIPNNGDILIDNHRIISGWKYRSLIGYLPQIAHFPENLMVSELFNMIQDIRNEKADFSEFIKIFELEPFLRKRLRMLSGGTRQKVNMVLSLMFKPEIYIFDEPTVGLDPLSCVRFKDIVKQLQSDNKTIIITTHILSEVEELADEIIFLLDGKVYYHGSPNELMNQFNEQKLDRAIARLLEDYQTKQIHD